MIKRTIAMMPVIRQQIAQTLFQTALAGAGCGNRGMTVDPAHAINQNNTVRKNQNIGSLIIGSFYFFFAGAAPFGLGAASALALAIPASLATSN